ncbi:unnamed protein product [Cyberlindnera jadinii]|uniref:Zn(2)-C6 fungal-type domain-containing protein n=1 Tax=Cyberlindnera jadinii (strain ATCC 18201 / CBS 1600 / BCRC 20928 / JCM 3617 / NBRC 0987 / NRRL Y-1542) TaxID=983966 RepID=A0A0H5C1K0_CYBJN|nr:unnamed protein product [Cyberlindnera jadinii]
MSTLSASSNLTQRPLTMEASLNPAAPSAPQPTTTSATTSAGPETSSADHSPASLGASTLDNAPSNGKGTTINNNNNNSNNSAAVDTTDSKITKTMVPQRKRVRTGCLNCRRKHKKCDEQKPKCKSCCAKGEICEWPLPKLKKSGSRRSSSASSASSAVQGISAAANTTTTATATTATTMPVIMPTPYTPSYSLNVHLQRPNGMDLSTYSLQPEVHSEEGLKQSQSPRNYQMSMAHLPIKLAQQHHQQQQQIPHVSLPLHASVHPAPSPYKNPNIGELVDSLVALLNGNSNFTLQNMDYQVSEMDEFALLTEYVDNIAPSLSLQQNNSTFISSIPQLSKISKMLKFAMYTLASHKILPQLSTRLFQLTLSNWKRDANQLVQDATLLFLSIFAFHNDAHHPLFTYFNSVNQDLKQHFIILRLSVRQNIILMDDVDSILSLLSFHQNDFQSTFTKAQDLLNASSSTNIVSSIKHSPFAKVLVPTTPAVYEQIILHMGMVSLLLNKPMDLRLRSHPISHFAKVCCGIIETNTKRLPWFKNWTIFTMGKLLTHELEHDSLLKMMKDDVCWKQKLQDYWEGRGDV